MAVIVIVNAVKFKVADRRRTAARTAWRLLQSSFK
jgi:hypothetical protein